MNKYIQDTIRNNLKWISRNCSMPQKKAIHEITRGLFLGKKPILRHLAQDENKTAKKQAEKYGHHLQNIDLKKEIDDFALRKTKNSIKQSTIIAYDLTDISKESAKKMEKISKVFDGSKRRKSTGYTLHGVGINNLLLKLEFHDHEIFTLNQVRNNIVEEISKKLNKKGIWVFDRGNDDKQFFKNLRYDLKVDFIARLKENRLVVIKKTGEIIKVKDIPEGNYEIYLLNENNNKVDKRGFYGLVIKHHLKNKEPIRLLTTLSIEKYPPEKLVTMYLERWGVENIFKRTKQKFELESVRVLKYQKIKNLASLIQFAVVISTTMFHKIQRSTNALIACALMLYKRFLGQKSITFNIDSFISFLRFSLKPLVVRNTSPTSQISLFSRRVMEKLGSF